MTTPDDRAALTEAKYYFWFKLAGEQWFKTESRTTLDRWIKAAKKKGQIYETRQDALASQPQPVNRADGDAVLVASYRRGVREAFDLANMINSNRIGNKLQTAEETCACIVRSLAELANGGAPTASTDAVPVAIEDVRDKWKIVDGDCREGADGLITYHVDAFDEGYQLSAPPASMSADAQAPVALTGIDIENVYESMSRTTFNFDETVLKFARALLAAPIASAPPANKLESSMTEEQIAYMVNRFLSWKLPKDFSPDAGISYTPPNYHPDMNPENHRPSGTNLFDGAQTTEMVRYLTDGIAVASALPAFAMPELPDLQPQDYYANNMALWNEVSLRKFAFAYADRVVVASALPAQDGVTPEGWKLVPVVPTEEMIEEGCDIEPVTKWNSNGEILRERYKAMIAAAPALPAAQPGEKS